MVRVDTLKLGLSTDSLLSHDEKLFIYKTETDRETGEVVEWAELKKEVRNETLGISRFIIKDDIIELEISAKALGKNYLDGINKDNIRQIFDYIRSKGIADFDFDKAVKSAKVFKIDIVVNLVLLRPHEEYMLALKPLALRGNYYLKFNPTGVEIFSTAENNNFRLNLYSKYPEMSSGKKSNLQLLKSFNSKKKRDKNRELKLALDKFKDILRFELSVRTFREMRTTFGLSEKEDVYLMPLLKSGKNILHEAFLKAFNTDFLKSEPFDKHSKSMTWHEKIIRWGYMKMLEDLGGNEKLANQLIDTEVLGKTSKYKKRAKQAIIDNSSKIVNSDLVLIKEILKALLDSE